MKNWIKAFMVLAALSLNAQNAAEKKQNTITVNSAQYTEYVKVPPQPISEHPPSIDAGEKKDGTPENAKPKEDEIIIFTGSVSISVSDGVSVSTIKADKVIYNKTRDSLTAIGNVFYEKKTGLEKGESFKGEQLLFSIKKLEGVFLNGILEQAAAKKNKDPFKIHTDAAGRNESGTIAFKDALLTTSKEDDPLWSIRASRVWLLPGNEMAFVNGFLSVGVVPLIYLPFFYYPADEMILHPVFGFRNREGAFVQTTTYLYGRKPLPKAEEESSFSNFLQGDTLKEQKLEGLFLKNLDEPAKNTDGSYLKLMADAYSSLGYLTGIEGKFSPPKSFFKQIQFQSFLGFSNTLYRLAGSGSSVVYSKYDEKGIVNKNSSNLFGKNVPFRYYFNFNTNITKAPFRFTVDFPLISDPFFREDFLNRSEDMNWFKYLLNREKLAAEKEPARETYYSWKLDGSVRPVFLQLQPWITSIALEAVSGRFNFEAKENKFLLGENKLYAPDRSFFHPKNFVPEFRVGINGTLFSTSLLNKKRNKSARTEIEGIENPFDENFAQDLKNAVENSETSANETPKDKPQEKSGEQEKSVDDFMQALFPAFKIDTPKTKNTLDYINYDLSYKINGSFLQDLIFDHKNWAKPEDVKWKDFFSNYYKLNGSVGLDSRLIYNQGMLNLNNSFLLTGNYQRHPWVKDNAKKAEYELNNFKRNVYSLTNTNTVKYSPFIFNEVFKPSFLEWSISEIVVKNSFTGTYIKPEWKTEKTKWDKDFIKTHSTAAGVGVTLNEHTQLVTTAVNLPPLLQAYTWKGNFSFPYGKLNIYARLFEKEKDKKKWFWEPFSAQLTFTFPYNINLSQSYIYNIEDKKHDKYSVSIVWKGLSAFYNMSREIPYRLDLPPAGWVARSSTKEFIPHSLGISYSNTAAPFEFYSWKNRIKLQLSFSTNVHFNLIRTTDSYFTFSPKITFKIHEFWDISFTSASRNDVIARYFQNFMNLPAPLPGEKNIAKDLLSSFYFWDEAARRRSGFKLKSLNLELTHYLKDWTMKFSYSVKPVLRKAQRKYELEPTISFIVQWNPITDIKVHAKKEDKVFKLERGEIK